MCRKFERSSYESLQDNALIYDIGSKNIMVGSVCVWVAFG